MSPGSVCNQTQALETCCYAVSEKPFKKLNYEYKQPTEGSETLRFLRGLCITVTINPHLNTPLGGGVL